MMHRITWIFGNGACKQKNSNEINNCLIRCKDNVTYDILGIILYDMKRVKFIGKEAQDFRFIWCNYYSSEYVSITHS